MTPDVEMQLTMLDFLQMSDFVQLERPGECHVLSVTSESRPEILGAFLTDCDMTHFLRQYLRQYLLAARHENPSVVVCKPECDYQQILLCRANNIQLRVHVQRTYINNTYEE